METVRQDLVGKMRATPWGEAMSRVELNTPAPDFELADFTGRTVKLSDFRGMANVLLVFNRGFT